MTNSTTTGCRRIGMALAAALLLPFATGSLAAERVMAIAHNGDADR